MSQPLISGTAVVFPRADIDTDLIIPAKYLNTTTPAELGPHALEPLENSALLAAERPIVIAGENFGCGSSREHAVWALAGAGVPAVIASSFARIFFRNGINFGVRPLQFADAPTKFATGDALEIEMATGVIRNLTQKTTFQFAPLPDFLQKIVDAGGLLQTL